MTDLQRENVKAGIREDEMIRGRMEKGELEDQSVTYQAGGFLWRGRWRGRRW